MYKEEKDAESVRSSEMKGQSKFEIDLDDIDIQETPKQGPGEFNFNEYNSQIPSYVPKEEVSQSEHNPQSLNMNVDDTNPMFKIANIDKLAEASNRQGNSGEREQKDQQLNKDVFFTGLDDNG